MEEHPCWCSRAPGRAEKPWLGPMMNPGLIIWAPQSWHSSHPLPVHPVWLLLRQPLLGVPVVPPVPTASPGSALPQMAWPCDGPGSSPHPRRETTSLCGKGLRLFVSGPFSVSASTWHMLGPEVSPHRGAVSPGWGTERHTWQIREKGVQQPLTVHPRPVWQCQWQRWSPPAMATP